MEKEEIRKILTKLDKKSITHPKFSKLWENYIVMKVKSLKKEINNLDKILDDLTETDPDIDLELLYSRIRREI